jgi:hypothetical protein
VIIAGISGAGKTTVHRLATTALAAGGCQSLVSIPQAATTTAHLHLAGNPDRQAKEVLAWLEEMTAFAGHLTRRAADGGLTRHREAAHWTPVFLLEGFVYDIPVHADLAISRDRVAGTEQRLAGLGLGLVLLTVPADSIEEQCVISTRAHRGTGWTAHLERMAATDEGRAAVLAAAQERLRCWADGSPLPVTDLDTSARDWDRYAAEVCALARR